MYKLLTKLSTDVFENSDDFVVSTTSATDPCWLLAIKEDELFDGGWGALAISEFAALTTAVVQWPPRKEDDDSVMGFKSLNVAGGLNVNWSERCCSLFKELAGWKSGWIWGTLWLWCSLIVDDLAEFFS